MARSLPWRSIANLTLQSAVLICLVAAILFVRTPQVSGFSMAPHISSGEFVVVDTFAYKFSLPKHDDIVAFRNDGDSSLFIKRVIGLPGDRVAIVRGSVVLDGRKLDEPYVRYADRRSFPEVTVPAGAVYVLGDNRADSEDSRFFGPVPVDRLVGRALAGIWPPSSVGRL